MLNWVDWLGNLVESRHLAHPDVVLSALGPQIRQMLEIGRPVIEKEVDQHGASYWSGLLVIASHVGVTFDRGGAT